MIETWNNVLCATESDQGLQSGNETDAHWFVYSLDYYSKLTFQHFWLKHAKEVKVVYSMRAKTQGNKVHKAFAAAWKAHCCERMVTKGKLGEHTKFFCQLRDFHIWSWLGCKRGHKFKM